MITISFMLLILWYGLTSALVAEEPVYKYSRTVVTNSLLQQELVAVKFDDAVYVSTSHGFSDLKLMDQDGNESSFLIRKKKTIKNRKVRKTWTAKKPSVKPLDAGGLEIEIVLDEKDKLPTSMRLVTPLQNFEQRVRILSSADGTNWEPAVDETVIFDYSQYMDVRKDTIAIPESEKRRFKILIDNVTVEQESELLALTRRIQGEAEVERTERVTIARRPFRIERVEFLRDYEEERTAGEMKQRYSIAKFQIEQNEEKQQTIILVDTLAQPLTSLILETSSKNFSRHAAVEVEETHGVKRRWEKIGSSTLSRLEFKELKREQLSIEFSESRREQFRIVIENRDSSPIDITGVKAEGNVYELLFLGSPESDYRLVYGADDVEPASYDTAAIESLLKEGFEAEEIPLGAHNVNSEGGGKPQIRWGDLLNNKPLLIGMISLLVIALGWGLFQAVKRMDDLPDEPNSGQSEL